MQTTREFSVTTPLGDDALLFAHLTGRDEVSRCFDYDLALVSRDIEIAAEDLLGKSVTVAVGRDEVLRHVNGLVEFFAFTGVREGFALYRARLRPAVWFLSKTRDNRIFQNKSVVDIIDEVLADYPDVSHEKRLEGVFEARDYCVQYGESDLDFLERLMEHEGIFYFFEHAAGRNTLVLCNANGKLKPVPGCEEVPFQPDATISFRDRDFITEWKRIAAVVAGTYTHTDYDFVKPAADLVAQVAQPVGHPQDGGEVFHYPGNYVDLGRGDDIAALRIDELQAPRQRITARGTARGLVSGATFSLTRFPREVENDEYLVLAAEYAMWDDQYVASAGRKGEGYEVALALAPRSITYRPERRAPKPVMKGPQTAQVVGPGGEEIYTDEYARVKVQFHWDRLGARDENSSCWVRVSTAWAGSGWGFIQIPRIGQEVIVDFLEGDPDQPIITGRVYNAAQMPPYGLPGNATQSGWKSNSSPGGGGFNALRFEDKAGSEEVYFQAEKDHNELVKNDETRTVGHNWIEDVGNDATQSVGHDRTESVGNDKATSVGNNRTVSIGVDDTESVGSNRSLSVGSNETIQVGVNSDETIGSNHNQNVGIAQTLSVGAARSRTVGAAEAVTIGAAQMINVGAVRNVNVGAAQIHAIANSDSWTVGGSQTIGVTSDRSVTIGGSQSISVTGDETEKFDGAHAVKVGKTQLTDVAEDAGLKSGKNIVIEAADSITLKCGDAVVKLEKNGNISLNGKDITLKGSGTINIQASGDVNVKGSKINQN